MEKEIAECQEKQQAATEQITELVDEQEKQKQLLESSELEDFERQSEPASVSESDTKKSRKARKRNEMCICRKPEGRFRLYC